ncbi:MAG: NAD(P)-dependent oxidoreductase [Patescibacteria group bacterium]
MKILVTGSSGFIGSNLIKKLKGNVIQYDRNNNPLETLDNKDLLKSKLKDIEIVYHLAGISNPNSEDLYNVNFLGTKNLIDSINELGQNTKIIYASTFGVYQIPQKGDIINERYKINPRNEYGRSKLKAESLVLNNSKNIVLRLSNIYGIGMSPEKHSVVANFIDSIVKNIDIKVFEKNATRDFLHIDDAIDAFIKASENVDGGIFNICTGVETSILDLIKLIEKKLNKKAKLNFSTKTSGSGYWRGDYSKAQNILKWKPSIFLEKGISDIIDQII